MNIELANDGKRMASAIAMTVVLVSFSMLFASLFLGYFYYRITATVWPPAGMEKIGLFYPALSTFFIVLSSISYQGFASAFKKKDKGGMAYNLAFTIFLGLCFLGSQILLWDNMEYVGLYANSGIFPSIVYSFTWIHVAHIVGGLLFLLWVWPVTRKTEFTIKDENKVSNAGKFWHFLDIVWLVIFFSIFVF